jgi:hypothetical protein
MDSSHRQIYAYTNSSETIQPLMTGFLLNNREFSRYKIIMVYETYPVDIQCK